MNKHFRSGLVAAAVVAGGMLAALPAQAQTQTWCNTVVDATGKPVQSAASTPVLHAGSSPCAAQTTSTTSAAPTLQNEYLVFFDWDKSNITPAADRILSDVVAALNRNQTARIHVVGHTDTSGTPAYNQRLSMRRAEAVKRALTSKGIAAANVTTEGKGETQLLVQTGANVREASNRRAQVLPRVTGPTS